jgi:hypothetical protein
LTETGRELETARWISGEKMRKRGIFMYHYSYVLPKQAEQKVGYYSNVAWSDAFRENRAWLKDSFYGLKAPFFLGERGWPILQWLERFRSTHPQAIMRLRNDIKEGRISVTQRPTRDIEKLLDSFAYKVLTTLLRTVMPLYWRIQKMTRSGKHKHV